MKNNTLSKPPASAGGRYLNSGEGHCVQVIDIGHAVYAAAVQPDTAFWALVGKDNLSEVFSSKGKLQSTLKKHAASMSREMETLRFGLSPSAVYFNPTQRCNLNCSYCYIPEPIRKDGRHMPWKKIDQALTALKNYFSKTVPAGRKPQVVFHGSEPLLNKDAVFKAIEKYSKDFEFGIQTNATLLESGDLPFLSARKVAVGISLDGHTAAVADKCRKDWGGSGAFRKSLNALEILRDYPFFSLICTVTNENVTELVKIVDFLHKHGVENCLLNQVRCTLEGGRKSKPSDELMAREFIKALDRTYELYKKTGRKLIVANFANIILSIIAPSARRLMCDINPCGGGRCFFAVSAEGDVYPCSEFIGLPRFKGGNIFKNDLPKILKSEPFRLITGRRVEKIPHCRECAIRHFCGAPCPAEAHQLHGEMDRQGAFCEFYEHQVRYAFRLIADKKESAFLWDNWDRDTKDLFSF